MTSGPQQTKPTLNLVYDWPETPRRFLRDLTSNFKAATAVAMVPVGLYLGIAGLIGAYKMRDLEGLGCAFVMLLLAPLLILLSGLLVRRESPVFLFLRPYDQSAVGARFQRAVFYFLDIRYRYVVLSDSVTNPISGVEFFARLTAFAFGLQMLLLYGLEIRSESLWTELLVMTSVTTLLALYFPPLNRWLTTPRERRVEASDLPSRQQVHAWLDGKGWRWLLRRTLRLTTDLASWQTVALDLARRSDAAVMDVSAPGQGLAWELEHLPQCVDGRLLLIAEEADLRSWTGEVAARLAQDVAPGAEAEDRRRMLHLLQGHTILVLSGSRRKDLRRFGRAMRQALKQLAAGQAPSSGSANGRETTKQHPVPSPSDSTHTLPP